MDDIRRTKTCERCKASVGFDQVKYMPTKGGPNGMMLVCAKCADEIKSGVQSKVPSEAKKLDIQRQEKAAAPSDKKSSFFCGRCNYNFKIDESRIGISFNLKCPYCGKPDRVSKR